MNQNLGGKRNIDFVHDNNLCHYCGVCYGVCPKDNIRIGYSEDCNPIFKVIDTRRCGRCDLCYRVCPGHEVDFERLHKDIFSEVYDFSWLGSFKRCYLSHATDEEIRRNAASGGTVSSVLIAALEKGIIDGAVVVKMAHNNSPLMTETYIARTKEDILKASGSKYRTVFLGTVLKEIWQRPKEERYAFVGLPCHIHGLRKAQALIPALRKRIVLAISIFCGRGTSPLGTEYVLKKLNIKKDDVAKVEYRKGKWPGAFSATLKSGEMKELPLNDYVYLMKIFQNVRCGLCSDHTGELADMSAGDAWLPWLFGQDGWNVVLTRTKAGENLVIEARHSRNLEVHATDPDKVKQSQKLMLYDKKHRIFPMMNIARLLRQERTIPKYTGFKYPSKLTFHDYFRALVFFILPRIAARKSLGFVISLLLRLPVKFLRMESGKKQQVVSTIVTREA